MASKRDKLKMLNMGSSNKSSREKQTTIVDELIQTYEEKELENHPPVKKELPVEEVSIPESELVNVIDKSHVGRPKILEGIYKNISGRLKMENYEHARKVGGIYGGMNAYLNWLIEEDIKRRK